MPTPAATFLAHASVEQCDGSDRSSSVQTRRWSLGVHDEDDRYDGEEDAVDVHAGEVGRRVTDPFFALSLPMKVRSVLIPRAEDILSYHINSFTFIPSHLFGG